MKFDVIIANPPYGSIGAKITSYIRENVEYGEFINLLPANDYKRIDGLWNYASEMETIDSAFEDATVTTHVANVNKNKANNRPEYEFIAINTFNQNNKLFNLAVANFARENNYAVAMTDCPVETLKKADNTKSFIFSERDGSHRHLPYSKDCVQYRWAVAKDIDANWILKKYKVRSRNGIQVTKCHYIEFKTSKELDNFVNFIYSDLGFRFISMLLDCYQTDYLHPSKIFPNVDWTHPWTVEEILKDYGYTDSKIKEVMEDLKNYKGMNN